MILKDGINQLSHSISKDFNWIGGVAGAVGGVMTGYLGGWDALIHALWIFVVADYITGLVKAWHSNELNSKVGFVGLIKKLYIFIAVAVSVQLQLIIGDNVPLREIVIFFYISNEGMSLLENSSEFLDWPEPIKKSFQQMREKSEKGEGKHE